MEHCSVPQSNGLRLSLQLCSTNQVFFPFLILEKRNLHVYTQSSLSISTATITVLIQDFRSASRVKINPNETQTACWASLLLKQQGKGGKSFQSKKNYAGYSENRRKVKENFLHFSCLKGLTEILKQGSPCSMALVRMGLRMQFQSGQEESVLRRQGRKDGNSVAA